MLAFGLHFAAKVVIASESGRRFHQDRQSGAMGLLLVTPLPVEKIVAGHREAFWRKFQPALWAISLVNMVTFVFFMIMTSKDGNNVESDEFISLLEVFFGGAVMLWLDANALCWVGMWRGLKANKYPRSVLATWGQVVLAPWLALFFFFFFMVLGSGGGGDGEAIPVFILLWFGVGVAADVASIGWASEKLATSLRATVSEGHGG
jgi:hypothetical protein